MAFELFAKELRAAMPALKLNTNEPMSEHCSFRIGGPADIFAEPSSENEVAALCGFLRERGVKPFILGKGTNLLVPDNGIRGVVIRLGEICDIVRTTGGVSAGSGAALSKIAVFARDEGLGGMEFAHGIPGSLGGAVMMNAGAYGGEMKDIVATVRYLDGDGNICESAENGFSYRHSRFTDTDGVILGAKLSLVPDEPDKIYERMKELMRRRSDSQPLDRASAGSTFKRPETGYAAAMIDGAGLKGCAVGGAQVSEKHAGFVINTGGATFSDVKALMEKIQNAVFEKYGVMLEPEVKIVG